MFKPVITAGADATRESPDVGADVIAAGADARRDSSWTKVTVDELGFIEDALASVLGTRGAAIWWMSFQRVFQRAASSSID